MSHQGVKMKYLFLLMFRYFAAVALIACLAWIFGAGRNVYIALAIFGLAGMAASISTAWFLAVVDWIFNRRS